MTTLLATLGNPDYSIYLPAWPAASDTLNKRLTSQGSDGISWQAKALIKKRDAEDYDEFIQKQFELFERHLLQVTRDVRSHFFKISFDKKMAQRLSNEAAETVWRIIHSMNQNAGRKTNAIRVRLDEVAFAMEVRRVWAVAPMIRFVQVTSFRRQ